MGSVNACILDGRSNFISMYSPCHRASTLQSAMAIQLTQTLLMLVRDCDTRAGLFSAHRLR